MQDAHPFLTTEATDEVAATATDATAEAWAARTDVVWVNDIAVPA